MTAWPDILSAAGPAHQAFARALARSAHQQTELLLSILRANADCAYGRAHQFAGIETVAAFQEQVPLCDYESLAPAIRRMFSGAPNVLTSSEVIAFEETSGSTSGPKLIPYTAPGLRAFRDAVLPWLSDLATCRPAVAKGPAYWSISPAGRPARTSPAGVPVGLGSDAAYFGEALAPAICALSAVPLELGALEDIEIWRLETLRHLLAARDLAFISVWSPTFLTQLLRALEGHGDVLVKALHDGDGFAGTTAFPLPPDPARADDVERVLAASTGEGLTSLWPALDTISCWKDGAASSAAQELGTWLPGVHMQGKGLLATEGAMTVPWSAAGGCVPAFTSGFLEFMDEAGQVLMAHQLAEGRSYELVMTTWAGLYRYRTGDQVRCIRLVGQVPALEFIGRAGNVSDLVGEKLPEAFVAACLEDQSGFCALIPHRAGRPAYWIVHDNPDAADDLSATIDGRLSQNPQYAYARRLGQLGQVESRYCADADRRYTAHLMNTGLRLGDIKPAALICDQDLALCLLDPVK